MTENNQAPENQETPNEPKLLAGKFKSAEELEAAYGDTVREYSRVAEERDRLSRYVTLMDQPASQTTETQTSEPTEDDEVPASVKNFVRKTLTEAQKTAQNSIDLENRFFSKYPDLANHKKLVILTTAEVRQEPSTRVMSIDQVMQEVASRTRAEIERIRSDGRTPPHVEGGSRADRAPAPRNKEPETEQERLNAFMQEERNRRKKHLGKG